METATEIMARMRQEPDIAGMVRTLLDSVEQAIASGDWQVDGRNDPEFLIERLRRYLPPNHPTNND